jgi:uncharacterized phage-like protein YoqJ
LDKIIGFTGHRPDRLGGYGSVVTDRLLWLAICYLEQERPVKVISGMALGWDLAVAEAAVYLDIPFIAAVPFPCQDAKWNPEDALRYRHLLNKAQFMYVHAQTYSLRHLFERNHWIVDNCTQLAALWDGRKKGGTWDCVEYAMQRYKPIDYLWNDFVETT